MKSCGLLPLGWAGVRPKSPAQKGGPHMGGPCSAAVGAGTPLPRAWPVRGAESCPPRKRPAELGELLSGKPWPSRAQEGGGQAYRLCVPNPDSDLATPQMWAGEQGWEDATLPEAGPGLQGQEGALKLGCECWTQMGSLWSGPAKPPSCTSITLLGPRGRELPGLEPTPHVALSAGCPALAGAS